MLHESEMSPDPLQQFHEWCRQAASLPRREPTAVSLATATPAGVPSLRVVLLREVDERGFVFYTNFDSRKGRELALNPQAALLLYWDELSRQIRIEGSVQIVSAEQADTYFAARPRGHQIAAWASQQSEVIAGREVLEQRFAEVTTRYEAQPVPRPPHWGGFRLIPHTYEFWQACENRMHDRFRYRLSPASHWIMERLSP